MTDFNEVYKERRARCLKNRKSATDWNGRAASMSAEPFAQNHYNREFLKRVDVKGCRTLLDIGCGPGNLLLQYAPRLEHVYGVDYASAMLDEVRRHAAAMGVKNFTLFERDWQACLDDVPQADVVIASRCMDVDDMQAALLRLDGLALRKVALTYRVGHSYLSDELLQITGRSEPPRPDYTLIMKILEQVGIRGEMDVIETPDKRSVYATEDAFLDRVRWSLSDLTADEEQALIRYFREDMPKDAEGRGIHTHPIRWALISWEKNH